MFWTCRKKSGQSNNFWLSYGPLKYVYIYGQNVFFWNNSKNIDIWILRKEQNLFRSEFYMCVWSLVKIDREMPVTNPRWPPRTLVFLSIQFFSRTTSADPEHKYLSPSSKGSYWVLLHFLSPSGFYRDCSHSIPSLILGLPLMFLETKNTFISYFNRPISYVQLLILTYALGDEIKTSSRRLISEEILTWLWMSTWKSNLFHWQKHFEVDNFHR